MISILLNPLVFTLLVKRRGGGTAASAPMPDTPPEPATRTILIGYGRVGRSIARRLAGTGVDLTVIEDQRDTVTTAEGAGHHVVWGDATAAEVLDRAGAGKATVLLIAIPEGVQAGVIAARARKLNPAIRIVARAHSEEEAGDLRRWGADLVILAEEETAARMAERAER